MMVCDDLAPSSAMILTGKNLCERQKDLNAKVNAAVTQKIDFEEIKKLNETSDIEKLFKIDVASKYKNIDYIIEILKSGDDLHISRALRCKWLYNNEYSHIVNPDYLQENVFPHMSSKMQRKMLTAISMHIQDEKLAESFYTHCLKFQKYHIEMKFFPVMSVAARLKHFDELHTLDLPEKINHFDTAKLVQYVGDSFVLAEDYIKKIHNMHRDEICHQLRHLYSVSNQEYLDLLEKYAEMQTKQVFGLRMSKDIAIKYKDRILARPLLYLQKLNTAMLVKHSTRNEVELFAKTWLPDEVAKFWEGKYCKTHKPLLDAIPAEQRFEFVKGIFNEKYPGQEFETTNEFYTSESYLIMTKEQKQTWALQNLEQKKPMIENTKKLVWGIIPNIQRTEKPFYFVWYKFLPFEKALALAKKSETRKNEYENITTSLIESCKSQSDLEKLFEYYHQIIHTEDAESKFNFVKSVRELCKVFQFKEKCWNLFQKLLLDKDVAELSKKNASESTETTVFLYYVIHNKEMPKELEHYNVHKAFYTHGEYKLTETQKKKLYKFLLNYYVNELKELEGSSCESEEDGRQARRALHAIVHLMEKNNKHRSEIPEIVQQYLKIHWEDFEHYQIFEPTEKELYRDLKKDVALVKPTENTKLSLTVNKDYKLTKFLKKLRVYFPHDSVTQEYLSLFQECLHTPDEDTGFRQNAFLFCVAGIFLLSNKTDVDNFVTAHIPITGKIKDWGAAEPSVLIQQAICVHAHFARPLPDPAIIAQYVKGDYVTDCSGILKALMANLPLKKGIEFVGALLASSDAKAQNQALKLAFRNIPEDILYPFLLNVWKIIKDKKIRKILFYSVTSDTLNHPQRDKMYREFLRPMTLTLRKGELSFIETDTEDLIDDIKGIHLQTLWEITNKLGNNSNRSNVLKDIADNISHMDKDLLTKMVSEFIQELWNKKQSSPENQSSKATVIATYLLVYTGNDEINKTRELADLAMKKLIDLHFNGTTIEKVFIWKFLSKLAKQNICESNEYQTANEILTLVLNKILNSIPFENISYICFWEIKLAIIWNKTMDMGNPMLENKDADRKTITKELMKNYSEQVNSTVEDLIATEHYSKLYISQVAKKIVNSLEMLSLNLRNGEDLVWLNFHIFFVDNLADFAKEESLILGLHVLPAECAIPTCALDYGKLLEKLDSIDNAQVQALLKSKFYGPKRRRLSAQSSDED